MHLLLVGDDFRSSQHSQRPADLCLVQGTFGVGLMPCIAVSIFADVRFSWEGRPPCRPTNPVFPGSSQQLRATSLPRDIRLLFHWK